MKKLLLMFVLLFCLLGPEVKAYSYDDVAKPLVCIAGYDYSK